MEKADEETATVEMPPQKNKRILDIVQSERWRCVWYAFATDNFSGLLFD